MKLVRTRQGFAHWCPACKVPHYIFVTNKTVLTQSDWHFDGNFEEPTFDPGIRLNYLSQKTGKVETLCHYWIINGRIEFCEDSPHAMAGFRVPLPDWPTNMSNALPQWSEAA